MSTPTEEDYLQALAVKNEYERIQAEILEAKRATYYAALKPFTETELFSTFRDALQAIKDGNEAENMFSYNVEAVLANIQYLTTVVAQYQPPVPAVLMPAPLPVTPEAEGSTNG